MRLFWKVWRKFRPYRGPVTYRMAEDAIVPSIPGWVNKDEPLFHKDAFALVMKATPPTAQFSSSTTVGASSWVVSNGVVTTVGADDES